MYTVYGKPACVGCETAKKMLEVKGLEYNYIDATKDSSVKEIFMSKGWRSFPQIVCNGFYVGGVEDLKLWLSLENNTVLTTKI